MNNRFRQELGLSLVKDVLKLKSAYPSWDGLRRIAHLPSDEDEQFRFRILL